MPRPAAARKTSSLPESHQGVGVVRTAKVIPVMGPQAATQEPPPAARAMVCSGRCGHCDVHPCQLHATI